MQDRLQCMFVVAPACDAAGMDRFAHLLPAGASNETIQEGGNCMQDGKINQRRTICTLKLRQRIGELAHSRQLHAGYCVG